MKQETKPKWGVWGARVSIAPKKTVGMGLKLRLLFNPALLEALTLGF